MSVNKSHLTSGASVRPETSVTYSGGNGGHKIRRVFSETASALFAYLGHPTTILQRYSAQIFDGPAF